MSRDKAVARLEAPYKALKGADVRVIGILCLLVFSVSYADKTTHASFGVMRAPLTVHNPAHPYTRPPTL
jgi:hypothetical protein